MSQHRGLRLVEWIIALAVLAGLGLVLLPLFMIHGGRARPMSCGANLKQFGTTFNMYIGDWDNTYPYTSFPRGRAAAVGEDMAQMPTSLDTPFVNRRDETWLTKLEPYVKYSLIRDSNGVGRPQGIMRCTDLDKVWKVHTGAADTTDTASFGYNFLYLGLPTRPHALKGSSPLETDKMNPYSAFGFHGRAVRHRDLASPAETLLLVENATIWAFPPCKGDGKTQWTDNGNRFIRPRHDGKSNILFCDGHVTSVETKTLVGKDVQYGNMGNDETGTATNNNLWDIR